MSEWPLVPLGELVDVFDSIRVPVKEADRRPGPYPYYGASGVVDHVDAFLFDGDYLLIAEDGENLRTRKTDVAFVATGRFWVNNHAHIVRANAAAETRYLSYALSVTDISGYLSGSTMPKLTQANMLRIPVVAPPIADQRRIASILGALDDKIELTRRMAETMEALGRAEYSSWAAQQTPSAFSTVGDVADVLSGGTPAKTVRSLWNGDVPWISPKAMTGVHCDEPTDFVTTEAIGHGTRAAPAGATLVMVRGMGLHEKVRVSQVRRSVTFNQDVKALVPRSIAPSLLLFSLLDAQPALLEKVESSGHGTGTLPTTLLLGHRIPVPAPTEQVAIAHRLDLDNDRIEVARAQARALSALRELLLPRLISGDFWVTA